MKFVKKATVIVLTLIMFSQFIPFSVSADLPSDAILINKENWSMLNNGTEYYYLGNDIEWDSTLSPITGFNGTFDGQGYCIKNFSATGTTAGLFTTINIDATIKNLGVEISPTGIAASVYAGGLIGSVTAGKVIIENCYTTTIETGAVSSTGIGAGGLIGGVTANGAVEIRNCYTTSKIFSTTTDAGGLIGTVSNVSTVSVEISNCYTAGVISAPLTEGGLVGYIGNNAKDTSKATNSYWLTASYPEGTLGTPLTAAEMKDSDNFTDWDFVGTWGYKAGKNNGYPVLLVFYKTLEVTAPTFESEEEGYEQPAAEAIEIKNMSDTSVNILDVSIYEGPEEPEFKIIEDEEDDKTIPAKGSIKTWKIQPEDGLKAGKYTATIAVKYDGGEAYADVTFTVTEHDGVFYDGAKDIIAYGDIGNEYGINLTTETLVLPEGVKVKSFSIDGGTKWKDAKDTFSAAKFPKMLRKDMSLQIKTDDDKTVVFPKINASPKADLPKLAANYFISRNKTGSTNGRWVLVEKASLMSAETAYTQNIQIAKADSTKKKPDKYGIFCTEPTHSCSNAGNAGIMVKDLNGGKAVKSVYFYRVAPKKDGSEFTAASKPVKISASSVLKKPSLKVAKIKSGDTKVDGIKAKKNMLYTVNDSAGADVTPTGDGKTPLTAMGKYEVWVAATAKKPASEKWSGEVK